MIKSQLQQNLEAKCKLKMDSNNEAGEKEMVKNPFFN